MDFLQFPPTFFKNNRQKIFELLPENSIAIIAANKKCIRNGDMTFYYRQNSNFFYLTGINQAGCILIFNKTYDFLPQEVLFIPKPDKNKEIWTGKLLTSDQAQRISAIDQVHYIDNEQNSIYNLLKKLTLKKNVLFYIENEKDYQDFFVGQATVNFKDFIKQNVENESFIIDISPLIAKYRQVKTSEEILAIRKSIDITAKAFLRVLKIVKPGLYEYNIQAEITHEFLSHGIFSHAYYPIIAAGINSTILHYWQNNSVLNNGDILLLDFGAEFMNYAADLSRTIPINGKFSSRQRQVYLSVLKAQRYAKSIIKPGITINEINEKTGAFVENELLELGLLTSDEVKYATSTPAYKRYFMHGTSHFLGLDVHDVGTKDTPLKPGHVITCEPGIYIPDEGFGIRLENDLLITDEGNIDLMENIPIEPEEIESLMNS